MSQEDGTYQDPVIKLYSCRILKDISQHRGEGKEIIWDPSFPHLREGIVHKTSIQPCYKGTCNSKVENEIATGRLEDAFPPAQERSVREVLECKIPSSNNLFPENRVGLLIIPTRPEIKHKSERKEPQTRERKGSPT